MTPWAVLLQNPITATDESVRAAFHGIAEKQHPDRLKGIPGASWHAAVEAYSVLKTIKTRSEALRRSNLLAGTCPLCKGIGTVQRRVSKPAVLCEKCKGAGR